MKQRTSDGGEKSTAEIYLPVAQDSLVSRLAEAFKKKKVQPAGLTDESSSCHVPTTSADSGLTGRPKSPAFFDFSLPSSYPTMEEYKRAQSLAGSSGSAPTKYRGGKAAQTLECLVMSLKSYVASPLDASNLEKEHRLGRCITQNSEESMQLSTSRCDAVLKAAQRGRRVSSRGEGRIGKRGKVYHASANHPTFSPPPPVASGKYSSYLKTLEEARVQYQGQYSPPTVDQCRGNRKAMLNELSPAPSEFLMSIPATASALPVLTADNALRNSAIFIWGEEASLDSFPDSEAPVNNQAFQSVWSQPGEDQGFLSMVMAQRGPSSYLGSPCIEPDMSGALVEEPSTLPPGSFSFPGTQ